MIDKELYLLIKTIIEQELWSTELTVRNLKEKSGLGRAGTIALIAQLEDLGILDIKKSFNKGRMPFGGVLFEKIEFIPSKLLELINQEYLIAIVEYYSANKKINPLALNEIKNTVREFLDTETFKRYFYNNIQKEKYVTLASLMEIPSGILSNFVEQKDIPTKDKEDYFKLVKAAKILKQYNLLQSSQDKEIIKIRELFFLPSNQLEILNLIKEESKDSEIALIKNVVAKAMNLGISEEVTQKTIEELHELTYQPKEGYIGIEGQRIEKKWLKREEIKVV